MRKPDLKGHAEAWKIDIKKAEERAGTAHATVSQWLLKGKFHPFWNHWAIMVVHLREVPGVGKAVKKSEDMTHEFLIVSLNPDFEAKFDPDDMPYPLPHLAPVDCAVQFKCSGDLQAADICEQAVKVICAGKASPDSDWREFWEKAIPGTAACPTHSAPKDKGLH